LAVGFRLPALVRKRLEIGELLLVRPRVRAVAETDGSWNLAQL
jgi:hypothetical protein